VKFIQACLAASLALGATTLHAQQAFPSHQVQLMLGFGAGSSSDNVARIVAERLREKWGQAVIVDNRPGAGANIAADLVAKAVPDGHTLLVTTSALAVSPSLYAKLSYDPFKDLTPVGQISSMPHVLVASQKLRANTMAELIAQAKAEPGKLNFASAGIGNSDHMSGELLEAMTGIKLVHVPYKGGQQAMTDTIGGMTDLYFAGLPVGLPMVKAGRVKALGTSGTHRAAALPDVPTIGETVPGYTVDLWYGLFAPSGTPPDVVKRISADLAAVLKEPDVRAKFEKLGVEPVGSDPATFSAFFKSEYDKWRPIIQNAHISPD
jgi:tripartite-type tricarboxylate transporter receptor subunit TctC